MTKKPVGLQNDQPRRVSPRCWQGLAAGSAIALATAPAFAQSVPYLLPANQGGMLWLAEGEGGEGGEAGAVAEVGADVAYLAELAIVEGHLVAAMDLYRKGMADEAADLSRHPEAEMMDEVRQRLADHGAADVTPAMAALSAAMEAKADLPTVEAALAAAQAAFAAAALPEAGDLRTRADALVAFVKAAAHEYEGSTEGGTVGDVMAYHEAHAFIEVARNLATVLAAEPAAKTQAEKALAALAEADEAFGDMTKTELEAKDPAILLAVAAKVELVLSSVR